MKKEAQVKEASAVVDIKMYIYNRKNKFIKMAILTVLLVVLSSFDLADFINNSEYYSIIKKKI